MAELRAALDDVLSELHVVPNVYPPDDFDELHTWKSFGISGVAFDLEVMDPMYWEAVCPGKSKTYSHRYWREAQVAAVAAARLVPW